ncbi:MAG: hypothetical protein OWU32_00885 [Firmicutes bacterium]|nr:hypothetical protein [Bacillota bacterium]
MFYRRRQSGFLLRVLLVVLGVRFLSKRDHRCSDPVHRNHHRARVRAFRSKLREAFAVWDDESYDSDEVAQTPAE